MAEASTIGCRALIGAAVVAAGAAGGVGTHIYDQKALDQAYANGMAAGRKAALEQIKQINGVPVLTAVQVARNTQHATKYVAQPVGSMLAKIAGDALSALSSAIGTARSLLSFFSGAADVLGDLESLINSWQDNIADLGFALTDIDSIDIESALAYLEDLATIAEVVVVA